MTKSELELLDGMKIKLRNNDLFYVVDGNLYSVVENKGLCEYDSIEDFMWEYTDDLKEKDGYRKEDIMLITDRDKIIFKRKVTGEDLYDEFCEFCVSNCNKCIYGDNPVYCEQQWIIDNYIK